MKSSCDREASSTRSHVLKITQLLRAGDSNDDGRVWREKGRSEQRAAWPETTPRGSLNLADNTFVCIFCCADRPRRRSQPCVEVFFCERQSRRGGEGREFAFVLFSRSSTSNFPLIFFSSVLCVCVCWCMFV